MSVVSTSPFSTATGNGATKAFSFAIAVRDPARLDVYAGGVLQTSGFTVVLNSDYNGGTVTFATAPANGAALIFASDPDFEQTGGFEDVGAYSPSQLDGVIDSLAIKAIFLKGLLSRTALTPVGESLGQLPPKASRAGMFFAFDSNGNPVALPSVGGADSALRTDLAANGGSVLVHYLGSDASAVVRTVHDKLSDIIHAKDFGLVGDGSDEGARLTAFFNSAKNNPGICHLMHQGTFCTSVALPVLNVPNVWIEGAGSEIHDVGTLVTGTVIKYIGASAPTATLIDIEPATGPSAQRIGGTLFRYIGIDCNSGLIGTGLTAKSIHDCEIEVAVANAATQGVYLGVVSQLGEARDLQRNKIRILGRQFEAPAGYVLTLDGDATANASMNEIIVDAQIGNVSAIRCMNSDNNYWPFVRALKASGAASWGMELFGGVSSATSSRDEVIEFYSGNVPIKVYGTTTFATPSVGHVLHHLDDGNGTPYPVTETAGTITVLKQVILATAGFVTPEQFGAKGDGSTDDSAAINQAFASGKEVWFQPQTTYAIASTVNIGNGTSTTLSTLNGVVGRGSTSGAAASEFSPAVKPTCLKWTGALGGTMVSVNGPIVGVDVQGLFLDANNLAGTCVAHKHMLASTWIDVLGVRYTGTCFTHDAYPGVPGTFANGAQRDTFINYRAKNPSSTGTACGMRLGVTSGYVNQMLDVAESDFINCEFYRDGATATNYSILLAFCDVMNFFGGQAAAQNGTLGSGVQVTPPSGTGSNKTKFPAAITFFNFPIAGGILVDPTWAPTQGIGCFPFHTGDGEPIPNSPYIYGFDELGRWFGGGLGYTVGVGGAAVQATSKSTAVTQNTICGQITLNNAALAANTIVSFTFNNTFIGADDRVGVWIKGGNASPGSYRTQVEGNAAGSRTIVVENKTAGSLSEALILGFEIFKDSIS